MKPSEVEQILESILTSYVPIYLWGPPGIGKSDLIAQIAKKLGMDVIDVRAVLLDPVDLRGLPAINGDDKVHWHQPGFLPSDPNSKGILFLDELAQAPTLVQSACLQLVLDRRIGDYKLPDGWIVVAASNRAEDRAGAHRVITPLLNRFIHLDIEPDFKDWQLWAARNDILPEVRAFLYHRESLLMTFDAAQASQKAFATPRSWAFVSKILHSTPESLRHAVLSGTVGEGPAAEFMMFLKLIGKMPDVEKVIANPQSWDVPKHEPSIIWATCMAVADRAKDADHDRIGKIINVTEVLEEEYAFVLLQQAAAKNRNVIKHDAARKWQVKHADLLTGISH